MSINRKELKQRAKDSLHNNWGKAILFNFSNRFIMWIFTMLAYFAMLSYWAVIYAPDNTAIVVGGIALIVFLILLLIFVCVFSGSVQYGYLNLIRNKNYDIKPFKGNFLVFSSKYFLGFLGVYVAYLFFGLLWSLLLIIPGLIKFYSYSQSLYIFKDRADKENLTLKGCLTRSKQLMQGHKFELFKLQLSFLGWIVLSIFTLGIGLLWVMPYMSATFAAFYDELSKHEQEIPQDLKAF